MFSCFINSFVSQFSFDAIMTWLTHYYRFFTKKIFNESIKLHWMNFLHLWYLCHVCRFFFLFGSVSVGLCLRSDSRQCHVLTFQICINSNWIGYLQCVRLCNQQIEREDAKSKEKSQQIGSTKKNKANEINQSRTMKRCGSSLSQDPDVSVSHHPKNMCNPSFFCFSWFILIPILENKGL